MNDEFCETTDFLAEKLRSLINKVWRLMSGQQTSYTFVIIYANNN